MLLDVINLDIQRGLCECYCLLPRTNLKRRRCHLGVQYGNGPTVVTLYHRQGVRITMCSRDSKRIAVSSSLKESVERTGSVMLCSCDLS